MKFMILLSESGEAWAKLSSAEQESVIEKHRAFQRALETEGKFIASQRLAPAAQAKTVRLGADGRVRITDGPFAETKEVVGGFYIVEAASIDEACDWARRVRFIAGANEVRQIL